jgi:hypothetical protein
MRFLALLLVPALLTQPSPSSAPGLLHVGRALTAPEIDVVVIAARAALDGKTFSLTPLNGGAAEEVLMGPDARPKIIKSTGGIEAGIVLGTGGAAVAPPETRTVEDVTYVTRYTGQPVRRCGGSPEGGEMVIEYVLRGARPAWTVTARRRDARDDQRAVAQALNMLHEAHAMETGAAQMIGGRYARAFVAEYVPPPSSTRPPLTTGDPAPNGVGEPIRTPMTETLWIDGESLLPLRWEVARRGVHVRGYDFQYRQIDLQPPQNVSAPDCVR